MIMQQKKCQGHLMIFQNLMFKMKIHAYYLINF